MANAVLFDILTAVRADIVALNLPQIGDAGIVIQKVPANRLKDLPATRYPCILIAPFGAETIESASNLRDDVTYPVLVCILASEKNEAEQPQDQQQQNFNLYLTWREEIRKSFSNQRLTSTLCHKVESQPLPIADREAWFERNIFASGMILKCTSRESRG